MVKIFDNLHCRELRGAKCLSCRGLAKEVGVSVSYYSEIENGKRQPSPKLVGAMADFFGVEEESLYTGCDRDPIRKRAIEILNELPEAYRAAALAVLATLLEEHRAGRLPRWISSLKPSSGKRPQAGRR